MPSSFFFVLPQIVLGIPIGALVVVLQFLSIRKWPIEKKLQRVLGVGIVCSVGLVALGLLQALIVRQGPDTNFLVGLLLEPLVVVLFVALAAVLVPFGIAGGFWLLQVRHLELPGAYRLALQFVGCAVATIGYFLPWIHVQGIDIHNIAITPYAETGFNLDAPTTTIVFLVGSKTTNPYPYALLIAIIAVVLVSILWFRLNRYNVWVKFVGRALNLTQVLLVLFITWFELAAINFASSTNVTLLVGFWLTIVGFLIITVAQYWPYFDDAENLISAWRWD